jgi:hypothetical protein
MIAVEPHSALRTEHASFALAGIGGSYRLLNMDRRTLPFT